MTLLLSLAHAASVAGFSTPGAISSQAAAVQVAGLFDADRAYTQGTLLVATHVHNLGLDVELVGLAGAGTTNWDDAGLGSVRVGLRAFFGDPGFHNALGVDVRAGLPGERVGFWVVHYGDSQTSYNPRVTWDLTVGKPEAAFSLRAAVGYSPTQPGLGGSPGVLGAETGVNLAKLFPVAPALAVLVEGDFGIDPTPFITRAGLRWRPGNHWSVDALVAVPVQLMVSHPVFAPALQVRGEL